MSEFGSVRGMVEQTDGRLTIRDDGDMAFYLQTPDNQPLSAIETHATVLLSKQGTEIELELTKDAVSDLADELQAIDDGEVWDDE